MLLYCKWDNNEKDNETKKWFVFDLWFNDRQIVDENNILLICLSLKVILKELNFENSLDFWTLGKIEQNFDFLFVSYLFKN